MACHREYLITLEVPGMSSIEMAQVERRRQQDKANALSQNMDYHRTMC